MSAAANSRRRHIKSYGVWGAWNSSTPIERHGAVFTLNCTCKTVMYLRIAYDLVPLVPSWHALQFLLPRCMQCRRGLAMRILSVCLSVRLSVRPSVRHTRELWQNGRKICPDLYTIWKNIKPSFMRRRMVGEGRPLLPVILGQPAPVGAKSPIFNQ